MSLLINAELELNEYSQYTINMGVDPRMFMPYFARLFHLVFFIIFLGHLITECMSPDKVLHIIYGKAINIGI